jgi:hypothetical protein
MVRSVSRIVFVGLLITGGAAAGAQAQSEDVEPRIVGRKGTTQIGFAGFLDRVYSSEQLLPLNWAAQIDAGRFITNRFVARLGLVGSGSFGGDDSADLASGAGAPALHASGGLMFYFTPQSILSFYTGAEYWTQITRRADVDSGTVFGKVGLQAALSSRASFFTEGGYGVRLTKDDKGGIMTRITGQIGLRIKF